MAINKYLSILTFNVSGLNAPVKRQGRLMDKKTQPTYMLPLRGPLQSKTCTKNESEGVEKIVHANGNEKKVGTAILMSDKINFKTKAIERDKKNNNIT